VLIGAASLLAQDSQYTLKVDVSMVSLDVAVFSKAGVPVTGLHQEDFRVFEDDKLQEIRTFISTDSPYNVLLMVDRSSSMIAAFPFLIKAVNRFFSNLRTQDQVELAMFDESVHRLVNWRSARAGDKKTVKLSIGGGTDFYKSLEWSARELRNVRGRKAALFFTDGEDQLLFQPAEDLQGFRKALQAVRQVNAPFHFVGLNVNDERARAHLETISEGTGGRAYFPESLEQVVPLYDQISRELGISYTIGYIPDRPLREGGQRRIEVKVSGTDFRVSQSRTGYSAN
ncbi:MAG TPA: VWA domain-containing protein, partial [Pyrinomonadaceae bacterium]|nr:VWA domain-containing protein [Pyrinomonadaceae bacterium]